MPPKGSNADRIKVAFHGCDQNLYFAFKNSSKMRKIKDMFAQNAGIPVGNLKFFYEGHEIRDNETPEEIGLADNELIDVKRRSDGGVY
jgi:hypothetical protein